MWFDSGSSHAAVLGHRPDLPWPADVYLEGSDQHRGWFHSSLLIGVGTRGAAPYRQVITHGFTVDAEGKKISKSLGNDVDTQKLIDTYGAEILRLWTIMVDYREDMRFSDEMLKRVAEAYRKVRNTCRYLLSNLYDFDPARDAVAEADLDELDRYALARHRAGGGPGAARRTTPTSSTSSTTSSCSTARWTCPPFYLDVLKDRLYCDAADGPRRRSAQTVLHRIAQDLARLLVPGPALHRRRGVAARSRAPRARCTRRVFPRSRGGRRGRARALGARCSTSAPSVTKALEEARAAKRIASSLEARVELRGARRRPRAPCASTRRTSTCLPRQPGQPFIVSAVDASSRQTGAGSAVTVARARRREVRALLDLLGERGPPGGASRRLRALRRGAGGA